MTPVIISDIANPASKIDVGPGAPNPVTANGVPIPCDKGSKICGKYSRIVSSQLFIDPPLNLMSIKGYKMPPPGKHDVKVY